jgi:hypothetical protein
MSGWLIILTGIIYAYVAFDQAIQGSMLEGIKSGDKLWLNIKLLMYKLI